MSFDLQRFLSADLAPREDSVPAPELAAFFAEGEEAAFRVRGLTGEEMFRVADERRSGELKAAVAEALAGGQRAEVVDALKEAIGIGESVPEAMAVAISKVHFGLVEPRLERDQVVRLFSGVPTVAVRLMSAIDALSAQGPNLPKSQSSTPTPESV